MKKQETFAIRFFARKNRVTKQNYSPLFVRITVNANRIEISLSKSVPNDIWHEKLQKCTGNSKEAKATNGFLETTIFRLNDIRQRLIIEGKEVTADFIKARYKGLPDPDEIINLKVLELYDEHNRKFKELIGTKDHSASTYQRHLTSRAHVATFIQHQYGKEDLEWQKVDFSFLNNFEHYFKAVRKCNHNSTMKYIKNLGKVIRLALGEGYLSLNPFDKFKLSFETVTRVFLTQDEVDKIIEMDTTLPRLDKVRDLFVFCIHTGVSFCDVIELRMNHIYEDKQGTKWIKNKRLKTSVEFMVPVLPIVQKIIDKYSNHPKRQEKGCVIPEISNQNYNGYLKEVADKCGIDKNISSHIARHTFATTITLNNDVPLEVVSKMLGHTDTKTTQIYAKMQEKAIKSGMSNLLKGKKGKSKKKKKKKLER